MFGDILVSHIACGCLVVHILIKVSHTLISQYHESVFLKTMSLQLEAMGTQRQKRQTGPHSRNAQKRRKSQKEEEPLAQESSFFLDDDDDAGKDVEEEEEVLETAEEKRLRLGLFPSTQHLVSFCCS